MSVIINRRNHERPIRDRQHQWYPCSRPPRIPVKDARGNTYQALRTGEEFFTFWVESEEFVWVMEELERCCSNCEYFISDSHGSTCNALHTMENKNQVFYCVDFERKDTEKQMQRNTELQKKIRLEDAANFCEPRWSSEAFQAIDSRWAAIINGYHDSMRRARDLEYRLGQIAEVNEDTDLTAEVIIDIINRQLNQIRYELNLAPKYVLLSSKYRRLIDRYFYKRSFYRYVAGGQPFQPLQDRFGIEPLTPPGLPDNFIQVVAPIQ